MGALGIHRLPLTDLLSRTDCRLWPSRFRLWLDPLSLQQPQTTWLSGMPVQTFLQPASNPLQCWIGPITCVRISDMNRFLQVQDPEEAQLEPAHPSFWPCMVT